VSKNEEVPRLVYRVPEAGAILGLSRNASYEAAKRGDLPTIRIGKLLRVPVRAIERILDMKKGDSA
jgi:predicted DNA-binding transcriptional regulator AlpA